MTPRMNLLQRSTITAAAAGVAVLLATPARGDVVTAAYSGDSQFAYELTHMPDLDQRRMPSGPIAGLPGNGGMYCVPTSCMNLCIYAANHGFPSMSPGPGNFQSNALYDTATAHIDLMGAIMGTSASGGTNGTGGFTGLWAWVLSSGLSSKITVSHLYKSNSYTPSLRKMALKGMNGQIVSFAYGRYDVDGTYLGLPLLGDRTGGHMVSLTGAFASGSAREVLCRDPASDAANATQSVFVNREMDVTDTLFFFCASPTCLRPMSALEYPSGDGKARIIDSYLALKPKLGYAFSQIGDQVEILVYLPFVQIPWWPALPSSNTYDVSDVVDVYLDADEIGFYIVGADLEDPETLKLHHADAVTGAMVPITEVEGAKGFVPGRLLDLYILLADKIICVNPEAETPIASSIPLPGPVESIIYDSVKDEVVVLSAEDSSLLRYRAGLPAGVPPTVVPIPPEIPLALGATCAINPSDGSMWFVSDASTSIWGLVGGVAGEGNVVQVSDPAFQQPTAVDFDNVGRMFVTDIEGLHELIQDDEGGWQMAPDREFPELMGTRMRVTRNHTNFDPAEHSGPGWDNIDPDELAPGGEEIPDCLADLDGDGQVTTTDLLALLARWGDVSGFEPADFEPLGGDGEVNVVDLLALLAAWGQCP